MFVSGLTVNHPVIQDKKDAFVVGDGKINYDGDPGTRSSYPVCASCAAVCYSSLDKLLKEHPCGVEITVVDSFPEDIEKYKKPGSTTECVELKGIKLVIRYYVA
jgi:hypothetical protein